MPPESHTYVIGLIQTSTNDTAQAYGFDLDQMRGGMTGSCTDATDFDDPYDTPSMASTAACAGHPNMPSCAADMAAHCLFGANARCYADGSAIDNQLSMVLPLLGGMLGADGADGAIRDQIQSGKILLMLQVSDINSFTDDQSVMVHAVLGQVQPQGAACSALTTMAACMGDTANMCMWSAPMGGTASCATTARPAASTACTANADMASCTADIAHACNWSAMARTCSGIMPRQTFAMYQDLGTVAGSIRNGRLNAVTETLPLRFVAMGRVINLVLRTVHFGGRITATNITQGEFGAQVLVDDIVTLAQMLGLANVDRMLIEGVAAPDLMPDATGAHCAAISAGMGYAAIEATLQR